MGPGWNQQSSQGQQSGLAQQVIALFPQGELGARPALSPSTAPDLAGGARLALSPSTVPDLAGGTYPAPACVFSRP